MECKCSVLTIGGVKYFVQCEKCKRNPNPNITSVPTNTNTNTDTDTNKFNWYERHILLIRDNPDFRLGLNLFCLFGYGLIYMIAYLHHFEIISYLNVKLLDIGYRIFLTIYVFVVFGYLYTIGELDKNFKYKL
jgi:hypothetical protein